MGVPWSLQQELWHYQQQPPRPIAQYSITTYYWAWTKSSAAASWTNHATTFADPHGFHFTASSAQEKQIWSRTNLTSINECIRKQRYGLHPQGAMLSPWGGAHSINRYVVTVRFSLERSICNQIGFDSMCIFLEMNLRFLCHLCRWLCIVISH